MAGHVCVITGGNAGIGFEAAKKFLALDFHVIIACRSLEKGNEAVKQLSDSAKEGAKVQCLAFDSSDLDSVRKFANEFLQLNLPLHVLVLNAGIMSKERKVVAGTGAELTLVTNHLGHFLLTLLLLPALKKSGNADKKARIVVVSSSLHDDKGKKNAGPNFDWENLDGGKGYDGMLFYKNSKLANMWFCLSLGKRLKDSNVICNAVTPGFIPTSSLSRDAPAVLRWVMKYVISLMPFTRTLDHGANQYIFVGTSATLDNINGKYFEDSKETMPSEEARDDARQEKLWTWSEQTTRIKFEEQFK